MNVFISVDMEGVAGIVDWAQCLAGGDDYALGREPAVSRPFLMGARQALAPILMGARQALAPILVGARQALAPHGSSSTTRTR